MTCHERRTVKRVGGTGTRFQERDSGPAGKRGVAKCYFLKRTRSIQKPGFPTLGGDETEETDETDETDRQSDEIGAYQSHCGRSGPLWKGGGDLHRIRCPREVTAWCHDIRT